MPWLRNGIIEGMACDPSADVIRLLQLRGPVIVEKARVEHSSIVMVRLQPCARSDIFVYVPGVN